MTSQKSKLFKAVKKKEMMYKFILEKGLKEEWIIWIKQKRSK